MKKEKTTILVTGSEGQLGKTIQELYASNDSDIDFTFVSKEDLDITKPESIKAYFNKHNFDNCINCAAYTNVEQAEKTPDIAFKVNAEGVKNLALVCENHEVTLIHISTDYVFDGEKSEPYTIEDKPNPINEYGKSKLLGEQYIQQYVTKYYIIRASWLYSKTYGKNFYKFVIESANEGKDLSITTEQIGCPTNTENLANYVVDEIIKSQPEYGIKHFSHCNSMTWYDFAKTILEENGLIKKVDLKPVDRFKTLARRPKYSVLG
ncbi:dTDP-4-dehydrorhamnose reductase [Aestuariivivens sp. NBU2969]|uniref:dTDP-4-dehydrorhamnose reductase n=1 Tax=Aestuariivivens sp. NBU2969 TaxID=2873267 RepID=UPI001CC11652|nr:dTDP-4-dehydrorhamnose reductase [Aestuariivivens sp. NBU2969]